MTRSYTAYLTYISTFFVFLTIVAGGIVHATGSGLGCPDWPLCFGQYFPEMTGAVLYEHSHRLIAGLTGVLVWAAGIAGFFDSNRLSEQKWLYGFSMILIVFQAVLGGLTVLWRLPSWIVTAHFIMAQGTFVLMVILSWSILNQGDNQPVSRFTPADHRWVGGLTLFLLAVQMVVGAWLRHIGSPGAPMSYTCDTFPYCVAEWVDSMTSYYYFYYVWHRLLAVLLTVSIVSMTWIFREYRRRIPTCYHLSLISTAAVLVQIFLGVLSVRSYLAVLPVTLHLALADLLLVALVVINLELWYPASLTSSAR